MIKKENPSKWKPLSVDKGGHTCQWILLTIKCVGCSSDSVQLVLRSHIWKRFFCRGGLVCVSSCGAPGTGDTPLQPSIMDRGSARLYRLTAAHYTTQYRPQLHKLVSQSAPTRLYKPSTVNQGTDAGRSSGASLHPGPGWVPALRLTCTARVKNTPASEASFLTLKSMSPRWAGPSLQAGLVCCSSPSDQLRGWSSDSASEHLICFTATRRSTLRPALKGTAARGSEATPTTRWRYIFGFSFWILIVVWIDIYCIRWRRFDSCRSLEQCTYQGSHHGTGHSFLLLLLSALSVGE